ncbi:MAG: sugar phosphate isomerase/epimerase family protein, partial [Armatimonadota bacterium]
IAAIGKQYGVRFQLEPVAWSPIHSIRQSLDLMDAAGKPENVGMVIDFWHLWAGHETSPEDVAALPSELIYGVHFCDGLRHETGADWDGSDEAQLRSYLPGEGDIDIPEWVSAVKSTGFDGYWSSELFSPKHWEWDLWEVARETKARMLKYIA